MVRKLLLSLSMFIVCVSALKAEYTNGVFLLNEDWFGHSPGSLNFYNYDTEEIEYRVFSEANTEKNLGNTSQFAQIFGGKIYIVSKQNYGVDESTGGRLIVVDAETLEQLASLSELDGKDGRSFVGVNTKKGYVGTTGGIYVFDLENYTLGNCIAGTNSTAGELYSGQVGDMLRYRDGKVYAVVQNIGVIVINPVTDSIENTIELPNIVSVFVTADGTLYASESGNGVYNFVRINPVTLDVHKIDMPDGMSVQNQWGSWRSSSVACDITDNTIYFIGSENAKTVSRYNFDTGELVKDFVTVPYGEKDEQILYGTGVGVEPISGQLLVTTTEAGYSTHFKRNWIHFVDVSSGEIEKTLRLDDHYWFQAMPFYPDNSEPVIAEIPSVELIEGKTSTNVFNLRDLVGDEDNNDNLIVVTVFSENSDVCTVVIDENENVSLTGGTEGETILTVTADSNGKVASRNINITVEKDVSGVVEVMREDNVSVEYFNLQGVMVENPENGIFIKKQGYKTTFVVL